MADTVPTPETLQQQHIVIHTEEEILQSALIEQLLALQFQRVDFVYEPGQFAVRGGIVDVYSYAHDNPYRIDFFGDEVDSIREFDIETQLSKSRVERCRLVEDKDRQGKPTGKRYMVVQQVKTIGGALHLLNKVLEG